MELRIEKLPDEPIVILTLIGNLDADQDPAAELAVQQALAASTERDYLLIDVRQVPESFDNLVTLLKLVSADARDPVLLDALSTAPIFIGSSILVETYIKKALPKYFDQQRTPVFRDREDALAYVRQQRDQRDAPRP